MMFMNEGDIEFSVERHRNHPALGPATRFLLAYMHEVNAHSDGWPYWSAPVKAAAKLMTVIKTGDAATVADARKALAPYTSAPNPATTVYLPAVSGSRGHRLRMRGVSSDAPRPCPSCEGTGAIEADPTAKEQP